MFPPCRFGLVALAFLVGPLLVANARADMITFDDLSGRGAAIADGYGGLRWTNFSTVDGLTIADGDSGFHAGVVSPSNVAFNRNGDPTSISATQPFSLNEFYLTAVWRIGLTIEIRGYRDGVMTYDVSVFPSSTVATLYSLNFMDVDSVSFVASGGTQDPSYSHGDGTLFAMDNLVVSTVPEPSAAMSLILGLATVAVAAKSSRRMGGG